MRRWLATCLAAVALAGSTARADVTPPTPVLPAVGLRLAQPAMDMSTGRAPNTATSALELRILRNANKYALNTWWAEWVDDIERLAATPAMLHSSDVRRYASVAYALSVSLATGAYSEQVTGVSKALATQRTLQLVQLLVYLHRANVGAANNVGWGGSWQAGLWAALVGKAGWLLGPALPPTAATGLARMLEWEADVVTARKMHYLRDRAGRILTPGDSGAEELAWDGMLLEVAAELLPHHPRRAAWTQSAYRRMVASFARPSDVTNPRIVNGTRMSAWLGGSSAEQSALVVNHGRPHPDYAACVGLNLFAATVTALVGDGMPEAALINSRDVYRALTVTPFRGSTIYVPGSAEIRYPWGTSWGTDRHVVFGALDVQMAALGLDKGLPTSARNWAARHLGVVASMQARSTTGQTYVDGDDDRYPQREEQVGIHAAWAYLTDWVAANRLVRWDTAPASSKQPRPLVPAGVETPPLP